MIIELTVSDSGSVLVNSDKIICVQEESNGKFAFLVLEGQVRLNVRETLKEIKNRLEIANAQERVRGKQV